MFVVWRCLFGVLTLLLLSVASASAAVADWSGDWDSTWRDRTARIRLVQSGDNVTGHYRLESGQYRPRPANVFCAAPGLSVVVMAVLLP